MILAKRTILVEGPSDELIVHKAYMMSHNGREPLADGVDIINVRGLSFLRFLEIAAALQLHTSVVTDNDGQYDTTVLAKYAPYADHPTIRICADDRDELVTLEDQFLGCNQLAMMNTLLGTTFTDVRAMASHMKANKTDWALKVLDSDTPIEMPTYIRDAVA
jgi:predicted ATP-dependent endonuclease of OLD family